MSISGIIKDLAKSLIDLDNLVIHNDDRIILYKKKGYTKEDFENDITIKKKFREIRKHLIEITSRKLETIEENVTFHGENTTPGSIQKKRKLNEDGIENKD